MILGICLLGFPPLIQEVIRPGIFHSKFPRHARIIPPLLDVSISRTDPFSVQNVDWYDVVKWCNARSEKEGREPAYFKNDAQTNVYRSGQVDVGNLWVKWNSSNQKWKVGYRLPTETEWEYAARGGSGGQRFPWGNTISHSYANYESSSDDSYDLGPTFGYHPSYQIGEYPYTSPVGSFAANGYGLYDMIGNVMEWCWDWYELYDLQYHGIEMAVDPKGPVSGLARVARGGAWNFTAKYCRVSSRLNYAPYDKALDIGFRTVLSPSQQ